MPCTTAGRSRATMHELISDQKDLEYPIDLAPGSYRLIFQAIDKEVRKFSLADDPNEITLTEHEYRTASYPWKSDLKIVKTEYRNCTY